ncbi:MAG: hypothetical protein IPJ97_13340 [Proteobacteria bacterium]|nr:hypothetical protein [Pseudomonadota bacterium]
MSTLLLIAHGIAAVFLIGAVSHQAASVLRTLDAAQGRFVQRFAGVRAAAYTEAIIVLYMLTMLLGALLYPIYTLGVREEFRSELPGAFGSFEIKEHFAALGLGLLPTYWWLWRRRSLEELVSVRRLVTLVLTVVAWLAFLVGHVLNNLGGM